MKKIRLITLILLLIAVAAAAFVCWKAPYFVKLFLVKELKSVFDSEVTIRGVRLHGLSAADVEGIRIEGTAGPGSPFLEVERIHASYRLLSLLKGTIDSIAVDGFRVNLSKNESGDWNFHLNAGKGGGSAPAFIVGNLSVRDAELFVRLPGNTWSFEKTSVTARCDEASAELLDFRTSFMGATISGKAGALFAEEPVSYDAEIMIDGFDLEKFCAMTMPEQFNVTGVMDGEFKLSGKGFELAGLSVKGKLQSRPPGGILEVKVPEKFLGEAAGADPASEKARKIIAALTRYRYYEAVITVDLKKNSLVLDPVFKSLESEVSPFRPEIRIGNVEKTISRGERLKKMFGGK